MLPDSGPIQESRPWRWTGSIAFSETKYIMR